MSNKKLNLQDPDCFKGLFEELYPRLCLFADSYIGDMDLSKDIVQEVFVTVWEKMIEYRGSRAIKSFLYTSVKNRCLDHLKSKRYKNTIKGDDIIFEDMESEEYLFTNIVIAETYSSLRNAINNLPKKSEQVIRLSMNSYSNIEIAEEMDITINTVKSQKRIAYMKLRRALGSFFCI